MKKYHLGLPLLLLFVGAATVFVHDFAYRRVDQGDGQYELGGWISHAGADMVVTTLFIVMTAWLWELVRNEQ